MIVIQVENVLLKLCTEIAYHFRSISHKFCHRFEVRMKIFHFMKVKEGMALADKWERNSNVQSSF